MYGDATGSSDSTVLLQTILNDAYDGETIDFGRAAYRCDGTVELDRKSVV